MPVPVRVVRIGEGWPFSHQTRKEPRVGRSEPFCKENNRPASLREPAQLCVSHNRFRNRQTQEGGKETPDT